MEAIGKRLEKLRKKKNMTLKSMAKQIGVPASTYRDWEYGREIKGEPYLKIAEVLNISLYELFGHEFPESHKEILAKLTLLKSQIESIEGDVRALLWCDAPL